MTSKFNATLWVLVALLFVANHSFAQKVKWTSFKYEVGNVKAKFPGNPEVSVEKKDESETHKIITKTDMDGIYFVSITKHSIEMADPEGLAQVSAEAFGGALEADKIFEEKWVINGQPGLTVKFKMENGAIFCYRVVLKGHYQYQLVAAGSEAGEPTYWEKFFKSFKFK